MIDFVEVFMYIGYSLLLTVNLKYALSLYHVPGVNFPPMYLWCRC